MNAWGKKLVHPDQFPEILKQKRKLKLYKIYQVEKYLTDALESQSISKKS